MAPLGLEDPRVGASALKLVKGLEARHTRRPTRWSERTLDPRHGKVAAHDWPALLPNEGDPAGVAPVRLKKLPADLPRKDGLSFGARSDVSVVVDLDRDEGPTLTEKVESVCFKESLPVRGGGQDEREEGEEGFRDHGGS
jgi:hypothetical protein